MKTDSPFASSTAATPQDLVVLFCCSRNSTAPSSPRERIFTKGARKNESGSATRGTFFPKCQAFCGSDACRDLAHFQFQILFFFFPSVRCPPPYSVFFVAPEAGALRLAPSKAYWASCPALIRLNPTLIFPGLPEV